MFGRICWQTALFVVLSSLCRPASTGPPAQPLTSADPFNPENDFIWTNDRHPPPRGESGRFVYLQSTGTREYVSLFSISGRPCSFMYVETAADLPDEGSRIRLSVDTSLIFSVIQVSLVGSATAAEELAVRRIYAYICSADGQWHALSHRPGQWTYDGLQPAQVGLPDYVDGGILAAPRFYKVPANASLARTRGPCEDHAEWRALDGQWGCADFAKARGLSRAWCAEDMGYLDPSLLDPSSSTTQIEWGVPGFRGCPRTCGNCFDCSFNASLADPLLLAELRAQNKVLSGCRVGEDCPKLAGAQAMVLGVPEAPPFPPLVSTELLGDLQALGYTCVPAEFTGIPQAFARDHEELVFSEGVTNDGFLVVRVVAPTQGSVVRYTIDGSDPSFDHGTLLPSGGVIALRRSGQIKARAVLQAEMAVTVRQSRIAQLPFLQVQLAGPEFRVLQVGHYVKASAHGLSPCQPGSGFVTSEVAFLYRRTRSNGCPSLSPPSPDPPPPSSSSSSPSSSSSSVTPALHQAWEVRVPASPVLSAAPLSVLGVGGVIGMAADGVPIFAPPPTEEDGAFARELAQRDACGGLALSEEGGGFDGGGRTLHHGQYHYRTLPTCLASAVQAMSDGHAGLLAFMLDGLPLYGPEDIGGLPPSDLDECGGHTDEGRPWYHYHARVQFPYTVACLRGCLDPPTAPAANPRLANAQERCVVGAGQTDQRALRSLQWTLAGAASERGLLLGGQYAGSVSVEMACPALEPGQGLAHLRYTLNGEDPVAGGAPGQGYGLGTATVVVTADGGTLKAMCEAAGTLPSAVTESPPLHVQEVAYNPSWLATAAFWNLSDAGARFGVYERERRRVQGLCAESRGVTIAPAYLQDASSEGVGALWLAPPDCTADFPVWRGAAQPDLDQLATSRWGIGGIFFDGAGALRGLVGVESVSDLVARKALPEEALSVEAWTTLEGPPRGEGVVVGVAMRAPGFLGKGWYISYTRDAVAGTVTWALAVSTEGSDNFGRGGLASVRATMAAAEIGPYWLHVAGTYDGRDLRLFLNGTLLAQEPACASQLCGKVTYPVRDGLYVDTEVHFGVGGLDLVGQELGHRGVVAHVRVLSEAMSEAQAQAAAARMQVGLQLLRCPRGQAGPYDGLAPCQPCPPGTAGRVGGAAACEVCAPGTFAPGSGNTECTLCPGGEMTPREGAESEAECTGPDFCRSLQHTCAALATCIPAPGSFSCQCLRGFEGDGQECRAVCGDGTRVAGEECDDGNVLSSDGCDAACRVEQGFECGPAGEGGPDACVCALGAGECCVRGYSSCLARSLSCEPACFANLTACLHAALPLHASAEEATAEYLEVPPWEGGVEGEECRRVAMKACALGYARCKTSEEAAAAGGGEAECSGASCIAAYGACMERAEVLCR